MLMQKLSCRSSMSMIQLLNKQKVQLTKKLRLSLNEIKLSDLHVDIGN